MKILGIRIDNFSKTETLSKISEFLNSSKQHKIFTPNPEMLVDAHEDKYFTEVLNSGDINVCDGIGVAFVAHMARYPGSDLMQDVCAVAEKENKSIYLLGSGSNEIVKKTADILQNKYPNLKIVGYHPGNNVTIEQSNNRTIIKYDSEQNNELLADIVMSAPDIIFVAFGHGKQEKWIYENLKHLPSVKIAMGVGGTFDYISGNVKRAPLFLRQIGLEWLYRLFKEPRRIGRIFKATFIFICLIIFQYARQRN
jgi:N-acetylglucosaminyldiphosphoundecaprenol N-acetyl-beta-D-mannosaminyltransferase